MTWPAYDNVSWITGNTRSVVVPTIPGPTGPHYLVGLDLGQVQDPTALVIVEQQGTANPPDAKRAGARGRGPAQPTPHEASYAVRHLYRFQLGTAYPTIVTAVQTLLQQPPLAGHARLIVDATGCGRPVVDMLSQAGLNPVAVSIHGGDTVSHEREHYRVPKRDLVGVLQVLLQTERLKIAAALPLAQTLQQEMLAFRVTVDARTAHDSYSAWREKDHDDLVLACALACWWGEQGAARPGIIVL